LIVEDEPYLAEAIRDGLRREAIAADIDGDGDTALELLSVNAYDIAVLDRDIPGPLRHPWPPPTTRSPNASSRFGDAVWVHWIADPREKRASARTMAVGRARACP
jgi:hypothetical protein